MVKNARTGYLAVHRSWLWDMHALEYSRSFLIFIFFFCGWVRESAWDSVALLIEDSLVL